MACGRALGRSRGGSISLEILGFLCISRAARSTFIDWSTHGLMTVLGSSMLPKSVHTRALIVGALLLAMSGCGEVRPEQPIAKDGILDLSN